LTPRLTDGGDQANTAPGSNPPVTVPPRNGIKDPGPVAAPFFPPPPNLWKGADIGKKLGEDAIAFGSYSLGWKILIQYTIHHFMSFFGTNCSIFTQFANILSTKILTSFFSFFIIQ
jgi:hypothetical protein